MSHALFDLSGRTALVTGSSRGLGRAIAEGLARAGARLIVNGVDPARVQSTVAEMRAAGHAADGSAFDVTDEAGIVEACARFDAAGIGIEILVNNAGIQWRKVIETNLTSAFVIGREAAKRMIPRKRGKIVNIGSLASELARPTVGPYTAAKGGIKNLTRAMAVEWAANGVQANAIGPGYMLTDMNQALVNNPDFNSWLMSRIPSKRWGRPDELVGAAVFLASSASDYVNGQIIYVDGGMLAAM